MPKGGANSESHLRQVTTGYCLHDSKTKCRQERSLSICNAMSMVEFRSVVVPPSSVSDNPIGLE